MIFATQQYLELEKEDVTEKNSVHMLWLLPQYIVLTAGEVLFSITSLSFSFTQAPKSMKAVVQALYLLTTALGNLIDIIVISALSGAFKSQVRVALYLLRIHSKTFILLAVVRVLPLCRLDDP